jgi:hypothetical protein
VPAEKQWILQRIAVLFKIAIQPERHTGVELSIAILQSKENWHV